MGTWGGSRASSATDRPSVWSVFVFPKRRHGDREEDERGTRAERQGLVAMKDRLFRLFVTLSGIAALALAGGASVKGW